MPAAAPVTITTLSVNFRSTAGLPLVVFGPCPMEVGDPPLHRPCRSRSPSKQLRGCSARRSTATVYGARVRLSGDRLFRQQARARRRTPPPLRIDCYSSRVTFFARADVGL